MLSACALHVDVAIAMQKGSRFRVCVSDFREYLSSFSFEWQYGLNRHNVQELHPTNLQYSALGSFGYLKSVLDISYFNIKSWHHPKSETPGSQSKWKQNNYCVLSWSDSRLQPHHFPHRFPSCLTVPRRTLLCCDVSYLMATHRSHTCVRVYMRMSGEFKTSLCTAVAEPAEAARLGWACYWKCGYFPILFVVRYLGFLKIDQALKGVIQI